MKQNEVNFEKFVVERSATGSDFAVAGEKGASGRSGRNNYGYDDELTISPNPVVSGSTSVRFAALRPTTIDFKVVDISGKTVLQQKSKAYDGNNKITINNLDKLKPGAYALQMMNDGESSVIKFSVTR